MAPTSSVRPEVRGRLFNPAALSAFLNRLGVAGVLAIAVTALGLALRIEHALTFDGPGRGSDYAANMAGVRWMMEHLRPFNFSPDVNVQVQYQPPLWWALSALILRVTGAERPIAALAVAGWLLRQGLLASILKQAIPKRKWSILAALSINAVLPISVLTDGKVNPEGLHSSLFMVAVYALWRMERQLDRPEGIDTKTAVMFGVFSGLAVLTKATAGVLLIGGAVVLGWRFKRALSDSGWAPTWRRLVRPAVLAGVTWCVVAGWWCGPNLWKYKHPFPHVWDFATATTNPELAQPAIYRRPLGWLLPLEWKQYLKLPIINNPGEPVPNFWAVCVTGTWSDFYNRGFCRLKGARKTDRVWGAHDPVWGGPKCEVTYRCVDLYVKLVEVGLFITMMTVLAVFYTARRHLRTNCREGSMVLPVIIFLGVFFVMLFALVYPFDGSAVLNPRYLLPISTPLSACLGIAMGQSRAAAWKQMVVHRLAFVAIAIVAALVVFERWGG